MVKSVLGVNHQGLRDWLLQRMTALIMLAYSFFLIVYFMLHPGMQFPDWHLLFTHSLMKIATLIFMVSLLYHAWVGIWTVITDYIKPYPLRLFFHVLVFLTLIASFFSSLLILWSNNL